MISVQYVTIHRCVSPAAYLNDLLVFMFILFRFLFLKAAFVIWQLIVMIQVMKQIAAPMKDFTVKIMTRCL